MPLKTFQVRKTHPPLPVVAPDFSYTMDLMFMTGIDVNMTNEGDVPVYYKKRIAINNNLYNKGYNYVLVFVETTSRKAWLFPQKTKRSGETYKNFICFKYKVNNKISRLLSDTGTAFSLIKNNARSFNYQQVLAKDYHTALTRVDRFIGTLRIMVDNFVTERCTLAEAERLQVTPKMKYNWLEPMWLCLRTYNHDVPHEQLYLYNSDEQPDENGVVKTRINYTPDEVWKSPRLRYRIRLRNYLDQADNYNKLFDKIAKSEYVYMRMQTDPNAKGYKKNLFAKVHIKKGPKFGNCFLINNKLVPYRNLYPAPTPGSHQAVADEEKRKKKGSKYSVSHYVRKQVERDVQRARSAAAVAANDEEEDDDEIEPYDISEDEDGEDDEDGDIVIIEPQPDRMRGRRAYNEARNLAAEARSFIARRRHRSGAPQAPPRRRRR